MPRQEAPTLTLHRQSRTRGCRGRGQHGHLPSAPPGQIRMPGREKGETDEGPGPSGKTEGHMCRAPWNDHGPRTGHPMETTVATTVAIQQKHDEGVPPTLGLRPRPQPGHVSTPPYAGFTRTGIEGWSQTAWVSWSAP